MRVGSASAFTVAASGCASSTGGETGTVEHGDVITAELSSAVSVSWTRLHEGQAYIVLTFTIAPSVGAGGWVGFGFGESMLTAQIALLTLPSHGTATVEDVSASAGYTLPTSTGLRGSS